MKKIWPWLLVLILALPTFSLMVRSGIFTIHDPHLFRIKEFASCAQDGIFPCRWAADSGKGYGEPLFIFYAQFPYWITQSFHFIGFSLLDSAKIVYSLSLVLSGLTMFLLAERYWGTKGGLISSVLYIYAPYRAVDVWVRGALPEALAYVYYPLLIYFLDLYLEKRQYIHILGLGLTLALLITTHNLSFVMFAPFMGGWWLFRCLKLRSFSSIRGLFGAGFIALALSAYYLLPVIAESHLVTLSATVQGYYDFHIHFTTLKELFISRYWGYGASLWARKFLSVSIGQVHWILPVILLPFAVIKFIRHEPLATSYLLLLLLGFGALFLTHGKSSFIWNLVPFMKYIQFPWRFLSVATFFLSLASGLFVKLFPWKLIPLLLLLLILFTNHSFFRPDIWRNIGDKEEYSGALWDEGRSSSLSDFWPVFAPQTPADFAPLGVTFLSGSGFTENIIRKAQSSEFTVYSLASENRINLPIVYFPGWQVKVNGYPVQIKPGGSLGLINLKIASGKSHITANFTDTPVVKAGNIISLMALFLSPLWLLKRYTG